MRTKIPIPFFLPFLPANYEIVIKIQNKSETNLNVVINVYVGIFHFRWWRWQRHVCFGFVFCSHSCLAIILYIFTWCVFGVSIFSSNRFSRTEHANVCSKLLCVSSSFTYSDKSNENVLCCCCSSKYYGNVREKHTQKCFEMSADLFFVFYYDFVMCCWFTSFTKKKPTESRSKIVAQTANWKWNQTHARTHQLTDSRAEHIPHTTTHTNDQQVIQVLWFCNIFSVFFGSSHCSLSLRLPSSLFLST